MNERPRDIERAAASEGVAARPSRLDLADRILALRDNLLARPGFQRWVARFPLTRRFARRKERALFDIIAGFVHTQVLLASHRLGLLEALRDGPLPLAEIALRADLRPAEAEVLVRAAVSLDLLSRRAGGRFGLGDLGAAVVATPALASVIEHNAIFYSDIADPVRLLRGEGAGPRLSRFWPYAHSDRPEALPRQTVDGYSAFMAASQEMISGDILDAYPVAAHRHLLDVGGGDGAFLAAAARRAPRLAMTLFDLPAVVARAGQRFAGSQELTRLRLVGGDFYNDALPLGADIVTLIRVLLDHDDAGADRILRAVRRALPSGGTLLVAETLEGTPASDAYFGFYLMAMGRGRARSFADLAALLAGAGFVGVRRVPTYRATVTGLVAARAP